MPAILRIDMDKPYLGKKSFTKRKCWDYMQFIQRIFKAINILNSREG